MNVFKVYITYLKRIWSVESTGFGDTVAKITKSFGIKPCAGCERRKKKFNEAIAYKKKMNEESKSNDS